jgi:hypothetical protein
LLVVVGLRDIADGFVQDDGESSLLLKLGTGGERNGLAGQSAGSQFGHRLAIQEHQTLFNVLVGFSPGADAPLG